MRRLALLLPVFVACGAAPIDRTAPPGDLVPGEGLPIQMQGIVVVELDVPTAVSTGDTVSFALRLRNPGREPVELRLTGTPVAFDVVVAEAGGRIVWRRLHDQVVGMILQIRFLQPGEVLELTERWALRDNTGAPLRPGTYRVYGTVPAEDLELRTATHGLVIRP